MYNAIRSHQCELDGAIVDVAHAAETGLLHGEQVSVSEAVRAALDSLERALRTYAGSENPEHMAVLDECEAHVLRTLAR